eukprot:566093-Amphidinium_carterae.1
MAQEVGEKRCQEKLPNCKNCVPSVRSPALFGHAGTPNPSRDKSTKTETWLGSLSFVLGDARQNEETTRNDSAILDYILRLSAHGLKDHILHAASTQPQDSCGAQPPACVRSRSIQEATVLGGKP